MSKPTRGIPTRTVVAGVLVLASFLSSFALSRAANRTELLWSAHTVLLPGTIINTGDLIAKRAALPEGSEAYVSQGEVIVGYQVLRPIGAGEFVPASAINRDTRGLINTDVPISVQSSDAPKGLSAGEKVNIYHVSDPHASEKLSPPVLVLAHVYILDIDQKSQSISSAISLTLSVPRINVVRLLAATDAGRIVVVRLHG